MLKATVGFDLDGPVYRHVPNDAEAGHAVVGPAGFLHLLETGLGLCQAAGRELSRVVAWQRAVGAAVATGDHFFSVSFAKDPFGVARRLLQLRDDIVLSAPASFDLQSLADAGGRIGSLAQIERLVSELPPGIPERLRAVVTELEAKRLPVPVSEVCLVDPAVLWKTLWRELFAALDRAGCAFVTHEMPSCQSPADLSDAKQRFAGSVDGNATVAGDGSLVLIEATNRFEAADLTAQLIGAFGAEPGDMAVVSGYEPEALDAALGRVDLPHVGASFELPGGDALQVLPLFLRLLWRPVDPRLMLEYLECAVSPLPARLRRALLEPVCTSGDVGGNGWQAAIADTLDGMDDEQRKKTRERIDQWLCPGVLAPGEQLSCEDLERHCGGFRAWATARARMDEREALGLAMAASMADAISETARVYASGTITHSELHRLLGEIARASVVACGTPAEAGGPRAVHAPGAVLSPAGTVVWWNACESSMPRPPLPFWTAGELTELSAQGVRFAPSDTLLKRETLALQRMIAAARDRLILVYPRQHGDRSEPDAVHPVWYELTAGLPSAEVRTCIYDAADVLAGTAVIPGFDPGRTEPDPLEMPSFEGTWVLPDGGMIAPRTESASSLEDLCGCPLKYVLSRAAHIRAGGNAVAASPLLDGIVAHAVIQQYLESCQSWPENDEVVAAEAGTIFDRYAAAEAAILGLPEMTFARASLRRAIIASCQVLVGLLRRQGLVLLGTEMHHVAEIKGIGKVQGMCDLVFGRTTKGPAEVILDLKWGKRDRREQVKSGTAIQLATYSRVAGSAWPKTAYFILKAPQTYTLHTELATEAGTLDGPSEEATWRSVEAAAVEILDELREGRIEVGAIEGSGDEPRLTYAACEYCEYKLFCGWNERT